MWGRKKKVKTIAKKIAKVKSFPTEKKGVHKTAMNKDEFDKWLLKPGKTYELPPMFIADVSSFAKILFEKISRFTPSGSNATWVWQNLTSTKSDITFTGGTDKQRNDAKIRTNELEKRINPFPTVKGGGMEFLLDQLFQWTFKHGRFAGNIVLDNNLTMVQDFNILDPYKVKFDKQMNPYYSHDNNNYFRVNDKTFFYYGLDMNNDNPYGSSMFEAATELIKISKEMLTDMKLSSSNAGVPRLHIKINQPDIEEGEDVEDYTSRTSEYFDSYVDQFAEIAADDNFYSWDDLEISLVGGSQTTQFVWKVNYQLIDEEIISAFHLYPWVMGKSSSTTKNWVKSQFDLLMSQATSLRTVASDMANWIRNTDLLLGGFTEVTTSHKFSENRDPSRKDQAVAERFEIGNVTEKVKNGIINPDDGARELGYEKAANPKRFIAATSTIKPESAQKINTPKKEEGLSINAIEDISNKLSDIEELIENLYSKEKNEN